MKETYDKRKKEEARVKKDAIKEICDERKIPKIKDTKESRKKGKVQRKKDKSRTNGDSLSIQQAQPNILRAFTDNKF